MDEEVKISQLPEATTIGDEDLLMIVQNGANKKLSLDKIQTNEDTGWLVLNDVITYRKKDGVVYVQGYSGGDTQIGGSTYVVVGNLPENFRPSDAVYFCFSGISGDAAQQSANIRPDGDIRLWLNRTSDYWGFSVCFPI